MAAQIMTSQTIPWPISSLDLINPTSAQNLLPLLRPSLKKLQTPRGHTVLMDTAIPSTCHVQIAIIPSYSSISAHFAPGRSIAAVVTETKGVGLLTAGNLRLVMRENGMNFEHGLLVLRNGGEGECIMVEVVEEGLVEVIVKDNLEFDHLLGLFEGASESVKSSTDYMAELVKCYLKLATATKTLFHEEIVDENPSVLHGSEHAVFESAKKALGKDLTRLMHYHTKMKERNRVFSVHYADINGLSRLENWMLADEISQYFDFQDIPYHLTSSTIDDTETKGRGWAISLCPIPNNLLFPQARPPNPLSKAEAPSTAFKESAVNPSNMQFTDAAVRQRIESGCKAVIQAEPRITEYDTIVGDGDCGLTLRYGALKVLEYVKNKNLSQLPAVLSSLVGELEVTMGGTSGALYCIFLASLSQALSTAENMGEAVDAALNELMKYTRARKGDRTCLDCLIPFVEIMNEGGEDVGKAIQAARVGTERTKTLSASLGRSAYLDEIATKGVPDPGAFGLLVLLEGICR